MSTKSCKKYTYIVSIPIYLQYHQNPTAQSPQCSTIQILKNFIFLSFCCPMPHSPLSLYFAALKLVTVHLKPPPFPPSYHRPLAPLLLLTACLLSPTIKDYPEQKGPSASVGYQLTNPHLTAKAFKHTLLVPSLLLRNTTNRPGPRGQASGRLHR